MTSWLIGVAIFLIHVGGAISAVMALMSSRTSQGAIAWIISLLTMPYLALPAYWVFGRPRFYGYVSARGQRDTLLRRVLLRYRDRFDSYLVSSSHADVKAVEKLAMMPLTSGNRTELLIDGEQTFDSLFAGIDAARSYILIQFFIVRDDALGRRLQQHLMRAAERQVRVYFLYDEIGSRQLSEGYLRDLRDAGINVSAFHSSRGWRHRFQLNFRNHRKILVVDGREGWLGGLNVGVEYLGENPRHGAWRDTHLKLTGPSVLGLQEAFWEDWHWATGTMLSLSWAPAVDHHDATDDSDRQVVIVPSGPADPQETASLMVQHQIHSAHHRLWVTSPYFVPDEGVQGALRLAAMRGVDVRIMMPERPDHLLVFLSAFAFLPDMIKAGIRVFRYQPGFLHQKVMLIDDEAASVGTVNLDNRSFRLNFEITALVPHRGFASEVEAMLQQDFANCREVTLEEMRARPLWRKLVSRAAYLLAPVQ
ncbi:cardiolipin synthase [Halomonas denitrificans]|uniref:cardiolipin synthase n=1 Tax=Halomonas TaxID=2745 RepID=UPI001A90CAC6|nr:MULTISPECIES: cardiolipin synthase [Halomonas]MED5294005.1 cardiolipin synthase [Pseudomonadota bacterium]MBN8411205.1 cardiolipin synthase [Halomonas litopenaei]MBY5925827.1 cardiolipin synthase [Halomonas sp. DP4Y7-2]MBY5927559.1 cardiolipin synthase [Halomonas sp. DP8Y7-3]MBY5969647.1 cardiolipin synthase [Halomonas denitrificans]